jgi:hypothetical protein
MNRRSRNRHLQFWWILGFGLVVAWMIWLFRAEKPILEGPDGMPILPFEVRNGVVLAGSWSPFDPDSLRLICTATRERWLVLQTVLPDRVDYPRSWSLLSPRDRAARLGLPGDVRVILYIDSGTGHSLPFPRARFLTREPVDTIAAGPLSDEQMAELEKAMDDDRHKHFGFMLLEQGVFMDGYATGDEVRTLAARCAQGTG